ncbi:MAG: RNA polymerase sigma factor [Cyclobacteriaceae bacterium]|nr:RNA polymerase sigma factor [Cyclobacteriaceae bacterium]
MIDLPEKELIAKLIEKNGEAFKIFVEKYQNMVFNTSLNFLGIREDAEEITQDVFVEVFKSIPSFRGNSSLKTWVYRIAITKSLEYQRKAKRKKRFAFLVSISGENQDVLDSSIVDHPGIDTEDGERADLLFKSMEKLPENQRIAFTLHNLDGFSYKEIAETMDISLSSVESLIFRSKKKLRKILEQYYESN